MKLVLDVHTHSVASGHAYSTILEYAAEAQKAGLELIAITDHAPSMPNSAGEIYFTNFGIVPKTIDGVKLMLGTELNIMDKSGKIDISEHILSHIAPVIASFHTPCYKYSADNLSAEEKCVEITEAILNVMDNKYIHILGHPGDPRYPFDVRAVVEKSLETGTLLEINNSSLCKNSFRYGSKDLMLKLLIECKNANCPVVIGSDAHFSTLAGRFDETFELLEEADFPENLIANTSVNFFFELLSKKSSSVDFCRSWL